MGRMSDDSGRIDRRQFLKAAGAALLTAFLSSCGLSTRRPPSPSPGASARPPLPTAPPPATATAAPPATSTAVPPGPFTSPLGSPTPSPTASPLTSPSRTPTPPPTPFPAGPPTKLGLFVAWYHPQIMDLIATGNVALLKTLEFDPAFLADVRARSPGTLIVGRPVLGQLNIAEADVAAEARRALEAVLPLALDQRRAGLVDAWEGYNEPVPGDEGQMGKLADLEVERVRLLAENGLRAVVGNFGTGNPPLEWWPAFRPALEAAQAHAGYLGLHEYSAPTIWTKTNRLPLDFRAEPSDEGWLTLRYRKVYQQFLLPWGIRLPLLMTECGVDGGVANRPGPPGQGWTDFSSYWAEIGMGKDAPGNYIEQLAWYDNELQKDDYVVGASIFAMTAYQEWQSYQLLGKAAAILQQYLSVHPAR